MRAAPPETAVQPPLEWRTGVASAGQVDARWWESFGDPTLAQLVDDARRNNPDVRVAIARVEEARATEAGSRALLLPSLSAGADGAYRREVSPFGRPQESLVAQPAFRAAYEVDLFGKNRARLDAAKAGTATRLAERDGAALSVTAAAASGYIALLGLDARSVVLQQTLRSREQARKFARDRARVGYTSQLEQRQAEAEYEATAQLIPALTAQIARQENALAILTGRLPGAIRPRGTLGRLALPPVPAVLPSDLLRRRPDVAAAEYRIAAADAQMRAARAQFLPSINLGATTGVALSDLLADPITVWSIGASVLAPIFQGGRLTAQLDTATMQRDQAAWAYRGVALNAFREVEDRLALSVGQQEQRRSLERQRVAVADALRHATNRYQAGYSPYIEQVDAQRALLGIDQTLIRLEAEQLQNAVALYQAFGGPLGPERAPRRK
ncbi:efflux transporter outer membrane subunit [Sphingomonas donggukensis]|uniref:Efflux transporter outer membrane subunit n=1 Tax=Sphingomonas donggukensis TaxID=2949093 RepID=A0ABY4TX18_9SPHN|nr:efflux transporter outer membrane subunit [Sphingomonas donggukensis]URW75081.1 efflux transporter outer membrane subunit [Sphingomonas donggukensis]